MGLVSEGTLRDEARNIMHCQVPAYGGRRPRSGDPSVARVGFGTAVAEYEPGNYFNAWARQGGIYTAAGNSDLVSFLVLNPSDGRYAGCVTYCT